MDAKLKNECTHLECRILEIKEMAKELEDETKN